ncbi:MAG: hypothetical protein AABW47_00360 [Nanoarchaeota archaeon]
MIKESKENIVLEEISVKDSLFFRDRRIERVTGVDIPSRTLSTERIIANTDEDYKDFPMKRQKILYRLSSSETIQDTSIGEIYDSRKISNSEWMTENETR